MRNLARLLAKFVCFNNSSFKEEEVARRIGEKISEKRKFKPKKRSGRKKRGRGRVGRRNSHIKLKLMLHLNLKTDQQVAAHTASST